MISICLFALALSAADATGTWTGTLAGDGSEHPAHLILKQEGRVLTGSGGPNAGQQMPILKGMAGEDGTLRFEIEQGGATMKFTLRLDGDGINGAVARENGGPVQEGKLSLKRTLLDLVSTLKELDGALFDAYNTCDLAKFRSYFATDVEFYHDKGGLMTDADAIVEATRKNVCGKVRRELVSIEVYPIEGYGAMETGSHKFYNRTSGKEETSDKPARFLHIWRNKGGEWKLTRVVSYAH